MNLVLNSICYIDSLKCRIKYIFVPFFLSLATTSENVFPVFWLAYRMLLKSFNLTCLFSVNNRSTCSNFRSHRSLIFSVTSSFVSGDNLRTGASVSYAFYNIKKQNILYKKFKFVNWKCSMIRNQNWNDEFYKIIFITSSCTGEWFKLQHVIM